ncbi:uncharacterized protein PRCAT00001446001 [Priceomyces carsonii]|uniref:uncharacterized protein n=1 Tax=Priceomyces carsonii TaxID=28549 RepID=UPI002ED98312|nr:unnamed protein product [Priceomyces carsonii]
MSSQTIRMASGYNFPLVGLGLWKVPRDKTADLVYKAIKSGYRHFDSAYDYHNEKEAGEGIRNAIEDDLVTREDIFITTKLWNNYHAKDHALKMAKYQNDTWGLGYIDLYLIHFPIALKYVNPKEIEFPSWWCDKNRSLVETERVPMRETWEALESLVDLGIVRSIGVSNCLAQTIYDIQTYNRYPISSLQIEHHPYLVQPNLIKFAQEKNISVVGYSSFGPQSFLGLPEKFSERAKNVTNLFSNEVIVSIAAKHNRSPAQILLRWATQNNIAVIPNALIKTYLEQNICLDFDLTEKEIELINNLDLNLRFNDPGFFLKDQYALNLFE